MRAGTGRKEYGDTIVKQIKRHGLLRAITTTSTSPWTPDYAHAVRKVFCDWYHDDLIYKGKRIVNWCPHCTTAIADDEAEYVDEDGPPVAPALPAGRAG